MHVHGHQEAGRLGYHVHQLGIAPPQLGIPPPKHTHLVCALHDAMMNASLMVAPKWDIPLNIAGLPCSARGEGGGDVRAACLHMVAWSSRVVRNDAGTGVGVPWGGGGRTQRGQRTACALERSMCRGRSEAHVAGLSNWTRHKGPLLWSGYVADRKATHTPLPTQMDCAISMWHHGIAGWHPAPQK